MTGKAYSKTVNLRKRDKDTGLLTDEFSDYRFKYLEYNHWVGYEKLDGTNIRISFNRKLSGIYMSVYGRTDAAVLPKGFEETIFDKYSYLKHEFKDSHNLCDLTFYGEGLGPQIQGNLYNLDSHEFYCFDVWSEKSQSFYLLPGRDEITKTLGFKAPGLMYAGTLAEIEDFVRDEPKSLLGAFVEAEGLIIYPDCPYLGRIKAKVKRNDYV